MRFFPVASRDDLARLVHEVGIIPFFPCAIPGWSVEEHCDPSVWFTAAEGPWEWKGQLAVQKACVYGRLLRGKNAFISLDWFPDLANYRRDGYDFEGRCDDSLAPYKDRQLMSWLEAHAPAQSRIARRDCGFTKGYDTVLTRLEMQTYIVNQDFVYSLDRQGRPYGWGNALLTTPERWLGEDVVSAADSRRPDESLERMARHLHALMPDVSEDAIRRELR